MAWLGRATGLSRGRGRGRTNRQLAGFSNGAGIPAVSGGTAPTEQTFPAAGEHAITLAIRQATLSRPIVVGVLPSTDLDDLDPQGPAARARQAASSFIASKRKL